MTTTEPPIAGADDFVVGLARCNEPDAVLDDTLRAVAQSTRRPAWVLLVDNGDAPLSLERADALRRLAGAPLSVVRPRRNLGCAGAWNLIHRTTRPRITIVLNADCAVAPDTFERALAHPAPAVVLAYGFGCFRIDSEIRDRVGDFDETFYPVYLEDADYRCRLRLAGVQTVEWPTEPVARVAPGRERAASGVVHGKHDPDGYQGWRGPRLAWFHACVEANRRYFLAKWGGEPNAEAYTTPFGEPP
jgi:hypothetical protein